MNYRLVLQLVGKVLFIAALLMLPAIAVAIIYRDGSLDALLSGMLVTVLIGAAFTLVSHPKNTNLRSRDGFAIVALCWIVLGLCGAIPFYLSGYFGSYVNCVFETVSGFTTTGATILENVEIIPKGLLFWRSFTHWIGGMGILVLTLALIPQMGSRSMHLLRAESTGPSPDKLVPRIAKSAKVLYALYVVLTVLEALVLLLCGLTPFDALTHSFSTAGTGGFSSYGLSVGAFNKPVVEIVVSVFMLLFSVNFYIYFRLLQKEWLAPVKNAETRVFFTVVAAATVLIALNIRTLYAGFGEALRYAFFQVSAIISTTGFCTQDFNLWPVFSKVLLLALMVVGGCAGSTAGGVKVMRIIILCKGAWREILRTVHPHGVQVIRLDGHAVDEELLNSVAVFFATYVMVGICALMVVSLSAPDFTTAVTSVLACLTNTGPGLNAVGPMGNFNLFSPVGKIALTACMLIGRLDVYPILMFFSPAAWRRY